MQPPLLVGLGPLGELGLSASEVWTLFSLVLYRILRQWLDNKSVVCVVAFATVSLLVMCCNTCPSVTPLRLVMEVL